MNKEGRGERDFRVGVLPLPVLPLKVSAPHAIRLSKSPSALCRRGPIEIPSPLEWRFETNGPIVSLLGTEFIYQSHGETL